jgi:predicted dehydrogenase
LKILIIGLGSIGKKHVNAILSLYPLAQIFALRSNSPCDQYLNVINIFDKKDIPKDLSFIIISNITSFHEQTINEMIGLNYPLFIEKPVLSNLNNFKQLSDKIHENSIQTYIACNLRFHPALQFIKHYIEVNHPRINEVNIYSGSYLPDWRPGKDFRKIYSANEEEGGGVHLDLIHEIDYCTWLFGFPVESISMKTNNSSLHISAVDNARYFFKYLDFTAGIVLNYFRKDAKRQIEIITENETIVIDIIKNKVHTSTNNQNLFENDFNILETYEHQMKYFIDCIQAKQRTMNDFDYAVEVLKLAIHE